MRVTKDVNINFELKCLGFRQNIKNLDCNFGAIYVWYMHANFQVSSSTGVGGE